ncbi:unnamed protein product [Polarella glacialis]|uniref:Phosphohistidine phosphatase SixA n=1 Tax=Polarella glacialis TaxID=89957 RepID=A0A813JVZ4_POLGL|nr:unnamed protein product [Polarella glacialis]
MAEGPSCCVLLRHGSPVPEEEDPKRPLSEEGRKEAAFTAGGLAEYLKQSAGVCPQKVLIAHSGKARAQQTAQAVAESLAEWEVTCETKEGLSPNDDPQAAAELVRTASAPVVVLVGHLPHLGKLAASLLQEPAAAGRLGGLFHPAGGVVLKKQGSVWTEAAEIVVGESWWTYQIAAGQQSYGTVQKPCMQRPQDDYAVLAIAYHNVAVERDFLQQFDKAAAAFQQGHLVAKRCLGEDHPLAITLGRNCDAVLFKSQRLTKVAPRGASQRLPAKDMDLAGFTGGLDDAGRGATLPGFSDAPLGPARYRCLGGWRGDCLVQLRAVNPGDWRGSSEQLTSIQRGPGFAEVPRHGPPDPVVSLSSVCVEVTMFSVTSQKPLLHQVVFLSMLIWLADPDPCLACGGNSATFVPARVRLSDAVSIE